MMLTLAELPITHRASYMAGYDARQRSEPITANPSSPRSRQGFLWDEGWADADEDARTE